MKPRIVVPYHVKKRDLNGFIWLALNLAKAGFKVALGPDHEILYNGYEFISPHIVLSNSPVYREYRLKLYSKIQEAGGIVVVNEGEGGVFKGKESARNRVSNEIMKHVDYYFSWGNQGRKLLKEETEYDSKQIMVTGHPRFDLLHSDFRAFYDDISKNAPDVTQNYFLINTNFTRANPSDENQFEESRVDEKGRILTTRSMDSFETDLLRSFEELIQKLAIEYPGYTVVVRPHPGENPSCYKSLAQSQNNIVVKSKGNVRNWILGAKLVIHNNCTTGLESVMMGCPAAAYKPHGDKEYEHLSNKISDQLEDLEELLQWVERTIKGENSVVLDTEDEEMIRDYVDSCDGESAQRITRRLEKLQLNVDPDYSSFSNELNLKLKNKVKNCLEKVVGEDLYVQMFEIKNKLQGQEFNQGLTKDELSKKIDSFRDCDVSIDIDSFEIENISGSFFRHSFWITAD